MRYETGSELVAAQVEQHLASALAKTEKGHQHTFRKEPVINIFATSDKFEQVTGYQARRVAGVSTPNGLFLAPQSSTQVVGVLEHELSHVLLRHWVGSYRFHTTPIWFREGLATWIAEGGGADTVSVEQAKLAIARGQTFTPNQTEGTFVRKGAQYWELSHHMFYRQASLFIEFLARSHPEAWRDLLRHVHAGMSFSEAYTLAFDMDIDSLWGSFTRGVD